MRLPGYERMCSFVPPEATIKPEDEPGILLEATWDQNGDVDRQSFLGEVVKGQQKIVEILPKLGVK